LAISDFDFWLLIDVLFRNDALVSPAFDSKDQIAKRQSLIANRSPPRTYNNSYHRQRNDTVSCIDGEQGK